MSKEQDDNVIEINNVKIKDTDVNWDDLKIEYRNAAELIVKQQQLIHHTMEEHAVSLESDKDTSDVVAGLIKSFDDQAKQLVKFKDEVVNNSGPVNGTDNLLRHITIVAEITAIMDTTQQLATTGFTSVIATLNANQFIQKQKLASNKDDSKS